MQAFFTILLKNTRGVKERIRRLFHFDDRSSFRRLFMKRTARLQYHISCSAFYLFLLAVMCAGAATLSFAEEPSLIAPESVNVGESFVVEAADASADVSWQYPSDISCSEQGAKLFCRSQNETIAVFTARIEKLGWSRSATVIVSKSSGRRPPKITKPSDLSSPKNQKIAELMSRLKDPSVGLKGIDFFRAMGEEGITVKDLVEYKAALIDQERARLVRDEGLSGVEAIAKSEAFWKREYAPHEQDLMQARQEQVKAAWDAALVKYVELHPDTPYIGAKMDVGGWASEKKGDMRFEGDIDFSLIMTDVEDAKQLRQLFADEIKKIFNLSMEGIDALGTAHRAATSDVYIGDFGAKWAEIDAIRRGKMYKLKVVNGKIVQELMSMDEKVVMLAVLENNEQRKKTGVDVLDQILQEGEPRPRLNMEPGISLEFLRHITTDAIKSKLSVLENIIKVSKYVNRSATDHGAFLAEAKGFQTTPFDADLVKFVKYVTDLKQNSSLSKESRIAHIMAAANDFFGKGWADNPETSLKRFGERSTKLITHNIEEGIRAREEGIKKKSTLAEQDQESKKLLDDLETEYKVFQEKGVEFPKYAHQKMIELAKYFTAKAYGIPAEEQKRLKELLEKSADNPHMMRLSMALVWSRITKVYTVADQQIDALNNFLDVLDNNTIQKLRDIEDLNLSFRGKKLFAEKTINIKAINDRLNGSILGKIGNSAPFKAFNLYQEGDAYWHAISSGRDWSESFANLGNELIMRRVPGAGLAHATVMADDVRGYLRVGVEVIYLIFPVAAVPEGLYGMSLSAAEWSVGKYQKWQYAEMVEAIYDGAKFEKVAVGKGWKMVSLEYDCPTRGKQSYTRDTLNKLPDECPSVSSLIYPQIKQHPVLVQYEETLGNSAVSNGPYTSMGWPYKYAGLNQYGESIHKQYLAKVDKATQEYFAGVIEELERRHAYAIGTGYADVSRIERELECLKPLAKPTNNPAADQKVFDAIKADYTLIVNVNKSIEEWKKTFGTDFMNPFKPYCTLLSLKETAAKAKDFRQRSDQFLGRVKKDVQQIMGQDPVPDELMNPLVKAVLALAWYDQKSEEYRRWYEEYQQRLNAVRAIGNLVKIDLKAPAKVCEKRKITISADYDRDCSKCLFEWSFGPGAGENFESSSIKNAVFTPQSAGKREIFLKVKLAKEAVKESVKRLEIDVLPQKECPAAQVSLAAPMLEIGENENLTIKAETKALGADQQPFERYFWFENGREGNPQASAEPQYAFSGKGKKGQEVEVAVAARTRSGEVARDAVKIKVKEAITGELRVKIVADKTVLAPDETAVLNATALKKEGRSALKYQWSSQGTVLSDAVQYRFAVASLARNDAAVQIPVTLYVQELLGGILVSEGRDDITLTVKPSDALSVRFQEYSTSVADNQNISICLASPLRKSGDQEGQYRYAWYEWRGSYWSGNQVGSSECLSYSARGLSGQTVRFKVVVTDAFGTSAEAETSPIKIGDALEPLSVAVSPSNVTIKEDAFVDIAATVSSYPDSGRLMFSWDGGPSGDVRSVRVSGKDTTYAPPVTVTVTVTVRDQKGRTGEATAYVRVEKTAKPQKEDPTTEPDTTPTAKPGDVTLKGAPSRDGKSQPIVCSYEYSEWGECSRATMKQTRTVKALKPADCVEKQKPVLEQGCTPPPSEEDKKNQYYNCLCRCYSGWAGHIGVWYDPAGKSVPECKSSGPCFGGAGAFGCTRRHYFGGPNDCAKGCWEGAFGKGTYDAKKADDLRKNENKKYKQPLKVKVKPSKNPADFGDIITLQAEASEGTGGYSYQWGGCAQDPKDAQAKVVNTRDCKSCAASVTVTDQDGESASDSVIIQCNTVKVKLTKESPKESTVPVGGKATFYAEVFSGDKPFTGPTLYYIWERNPDAIFGDPKNPKYETSGGSQVRNTAIFRKAGTTPVWVTVLREMDGRKVTIGESEQIPITVGNPELSISVIPQKPNIGQEVKLQVTTKPPIGEDIIGFWWEIPGYWTGTGDKASFKPKDAKPVKVTVHAKTKDGGDEVGTKEVTITAEAYAVSISEPRYLESPPQIWKCDTQLGRADQCGMVTLKPNEFAVFRDIFMKSSITPQVESPRYRWSVNPAGSCGLPGSGSELRLNCSSTGTYSVKLEVTNAEGAKLGEATQSVTISVSRDTLEGSKFAKQSSDKLQQAKQLVAQGKLDEGIGLAADAHKIYPKNTEADSLAKKWTEDKKSIAGYLSEMDKLMTSLKFPEARRELERAKAMHARYQPVVDAESNLKKKEDEYKKKQQDIAKVKQDAAQLFTAGDRFLQAYNFEGATEQFQKGLALLQGKGITDDPNIPKYTKLREDALAKIKRIRELLAAVAPVANSQGVVADDKVQQALRSVNEALALQPQNGEALDFKKKLEAKADAAKKSAEAIKAADALTAQGKALWGAQKYEDALKKYSDAAALYKQAIAIQPNPDAQQKLAELDKALNDYHAGGKLVSAGMELEKQKKYPEAIVKYRESLRILPDAKLSQHIAKLEADIKQQQSAQANTVQAKNLRDEGAVLQNQKQYAAALAKYRESLKFLPDPALEQHIAKLEAEMKNQQAVQANTFQAKTLRDEGAALQNQGKLAEAIAKYRQSLNLLPDPALEQHIAKIETEIRQQQAVQANSAQAKKLRDEGAQLQNQKQYAAAVAKYRESLNLLPDPALEQHIAKLEAEVVRKQQTKPPVAPSGGIEGTWEVSFNNYRGKMELQQSGSGWSGRIWLDAHRTWEQLTNILFDPGTGRLEFTRPIAGATQRYSGTLSAERLDGTFSQENYSGKFSWWAKRTLSGLDRPAASDSAIGTSAISSSYYHVDLTPYGGKKGSPRKVKNIEVDDGSWIRLKATHEKKLNLDISLPTPVSANSIAIISNLDNAHYVKDDVTTTTLTVYTKSGNHTFEIKAGVHSSEWNRGETGGADHRFPKENHLGDKRWLAVFPLPQGSIVTGMRFDHRDTDKKYYHMGAAPGFCLRGITLIRSGAVGVSADIGNVSPAETKKGAVIFNNGNVGGVYNNPSKPTVLTINQSHVITLIQNYHWNNARGAAPGTIALRDQSGRIYGPWQAKGSPGQGGVPNANWNVYPNISLPSGTYTVIDSNPSTWAQNTGSQGAGFTRVEGYPAR